MGTPAEIMELCPRGCGVELELHRTDEIGRLIGRCPRCRYRSTESIEARDERLEVARQRGIRDARRTRIGDDDAPGAARPLLPGSPELPILQVGKPCPLCRNIVRRPRRKNGEPRVRSVALALCKGGCGEILPKRRGTRGGRNPEWGVSCGCRKAYYKRQREGARASEQGDADPMAPRAPAL